MSAPPYVPVLPARPHARSAYQQLAPAVRSAVVPLWNLPPRPGLPPDVLAAEVRSDVLAVNGVHRHHPGFVDAPFADERQLAALAEVLTGLADVSPLRTVTGPDRPSSHQSAALEHARRSGKGLALRVPVLGEWDAAVTDAVRDLIARTDHAVEVDLLLDLAAVRPDRPDAAKEALRALDALEPLTPWRSTTLLSGGFPEVTAGLLEHGTVLLPRTDWHIWRDLTSGAHAYGRPIGYGDYGIEPTRNIARVPTSGKGGPPWGVLRYTLEDFFVLARTATRGPDRAAVNRAAAREILGLPNARDAAYSAGEMWLRDCTGGHGTAGTGNATVWLRVGNVQHITYVVRSLGA